MRIKQIHIQNFKSLVDFKLENLPQFCAFVGPNASGKSNIFEALEFVNFILSYGPNASNLFGEKVNLLSYSSIQEKVNYHLIFNDGINLIYGFIFPKDESAGIQVITSSYGSPSAFDFNNRELRESHIQLLKKSGYTYENDYEIFVDNFSRIFVGKSDLKRINQSSNKLLLDASNLSQIIGQIFQDDIKREDFIEWLKILIPEFENIEVKKSNIDGSFEFFVYEKSSPSKPFPVKLLSDGTKNILALMAAVYQSNQAQFLCIEEPENGLHPQAIELLVEFFRIKCEEEGHHIWLNTHSPTLIRCLEIDEVITVNKVNGETKAKQFKKEESFNIKMDEAWLTNALGGGVL